MRRRRRTYRGNVRTPGCAPGRECGSAGYQRPRRPQGRPAGPSGSWWRWKGCALGGILQQALQEGVVVLQSLHAAVQVVDLSLQELDLLGQLSQAGRTFLG